MKTDDLDLGQKMKILNFSYEKMNSQTASLFYIWKVVWKLKEGKKKRGKSREKNFKKFFFLHFYLEGWNASNKSCLFYAKFFEFEEFS